MKRIKKNKKKITFKRLVKILIRNTVYLIIAILYLVYLFFKNINSLVIKGFNRLPKLLKTILIYTLIIGNLPNLITFYNIINKVELSQTNIQALANNTVAMVTEENVEKIEYTEKQKEIEEIQETEEKSYNLTQEIEFAIFNRALENNLTENQAYLLVAISRHETGNWTSKLFKENNNFGGLYNSKENSFYSYNNLEEGLNAFVNLLTNRYFGRGLKTIEEIGSVYCPVGAANDPNGLNKNWVPRVTEYYNNYLGDK